MIKITDSQGMAEAISKIAKLDGNKIHVGGRGLSKIADGGSMDSVATQFYSPRLTPDTWYLPRTRKMLLKWVKIFFDWDPYIYSILCLSSDTKVPLTNGTVKTIKELYDEQAENFGVYSTDDDGNTVDGMADKVILTKKDAEVIRVCLSNGGSFKCTPDHLIKIADGSYEEAQNLMPLDKVFPLNSEIYILRTEKCDNEDVYDIQSVGIYHNFALDCGVFVHNCMHSRYPLGEFNIVSKDKKQAEIFEYALHNDDFDISKVLQEASLSYQKFGEAFIFGNFSREKGIWESFCCLDPALIEVVEIPFTNKVRLMLEIPLKYRKMITSKKTTADDLKDIPKVLIDAVNNGDKFIELNTDEGYDENGNYYPPSVCMIINKTDVGEDGLRGLPPITPLLKDLVYSDYLRKAQISRAQRFAYPIEIWKMGDHVNGFIPTAEDLENFKDMLTTALASPPYTIVWSDMISLQIEGAAGSLLPIWDDYNFVENRILVGLGTNKNVILGEGGWMGAAKTLSMQRLIMDYQFMRDVWTNQFLRNFVLRPICKAHNYTKKSPIDGTMVPDVPKISWVRNLDIQQDEDNKKLYKEMWTDGLVSSKTLFGKFPDLDFITEVRNLEAERGTVLDTDKRKIPEHFNEINDEGVAQEQESTQTIEKTVAPTAPIAPELHNTEIAK
jgi:hypothetical protein